MVEIIRSKIRDRIRRLAFLVVSALVPAGTVAAQQPSLPGLELNAPFVGTPFSIDADASGKYLVTASSSRSLTLWSRNGKDLWHSSVIHAPTRTELASAKYLAAITPDAGQIAFSVPPLSDESGGYRPGTARIYIIDRFEQKLITTFENDIPTRVARLKFSPDGKYLAAMLANGCGLRIWERSQWTSGEPNQRPKWVDDVGYSGQPGVSGCCVAADSRDCESLPSGTDVVFTGRSEGNGPWLLTLTQNGLRSYVMTDRGPTRAAPPVALDVLQLKSPGTMAITPEGDRIAIGDSGLPQIIVLDRDGLSFGNSRIVRVPPTLLSPKGRADIDQDDFFPNPIWVKTESGFLLYVFGFLPARHLADAVPADDTNRLVVFDDEGRVVRFVPLPGDIDSSLYALQVANASQQSLFFISRWRLSMLEVDAAGSTSPVPQMIAKRQGVDFRGNDADFRLMLSTGSKQLYFSAVDGNRKFLVLGFDFSRMRVTEQAYSSSYEDLHRRLRDHPGYDAQKDEAAWHFQDRVADKPPVFFGKTLSVEKLYPNERSFSGAVIPGNRPRIVWGTSRAVRVINSDGEIGCTRPITTAATRMNVTVDGRLLVVTHGDGVIRWYGLSEQRNECLPLIASLYLTRNQDDTWGFLAWLPNGKFMTDGGAAGKDLACYPVEPADGGLPKCIEFQRLDLLFSPTEVIGALATVLGTEKDATPADIGGTLAAKADKEGIAVGLDAPRDASDPEFPLDVKVGEWREGKRYLVLNSSDEFSLRDQQKSYPVKKPLELPAPGTLNLIFKLSENAHRRDKDIEICPLVYKQLRSDGNPEEASRVDITARNACIKVKWLGAEPRTRRKLWAVLIGFAEESKASARLNFAHEDALNFARFLQLDFSSKLPGTSKSYFDDVDVRLLIAPPKTASTANIDAKIAELQQSRPGWALKVLIPDKIKNQRYDDLVKKALKEVEPLPDPPGDYHWEHVVLVYFSGHGFARRTRAVTQYGLITPDADEGLDIGVVWLVDDIVTQLANNNSKDNTRFIIIDACRSEIQQGIDALESEQAYGSITARQLQGLDGWHFLFSSKMGHYSYEQTDYGIEDFVTDFKLWPGIGQKGSGVFSLSLLASLICEEALDGQSFNLQESSRFLERDFFNEKNQKWKILRDKLAKQLADNHLGKFVSPEPGYYRYDNHDPKGTLRPNAIGPPRCFP